ncbi:DUF4232 domain-containing protein [Kribbella sp. CA-294648]|uniref:DUF4232 domain-containing protein n=1 Tax=Kribbella sp. CA-294648 TaxID=3239948 RepID=UPI003D8AD359
MRSLPRTFPAVLVSVVLLLAGCGSQVAGSGDTSQAQGIPTEPRCGVTSSTTGVPTASTPSGTTSAPATPAPSDTTSVSTSSPVPGDSSADESAVKITRVSRGAPYCFDFDVTNVGKVPAIYTVTFTVTASSGEALAHPEHTVPALKPGQTMSRTVTLGDLPRAGDQIRAKVHKVRSVPAAEAPSRGGACPPSGIRVYLGVADAAMGLRFLNINLENCGKRPTRLNGPPQLQLLDETHLPIRSVKILHDATPITTSASEWVARPLVLKPGERAYSELVWRNTVTDGVNVNSPYARVWANPSATPVMLTPEFDLGTTGKLGVSPWKKHPPR